MVCPNRFILYILLHTIRYDTLAADTNPTIESKISLGLKEKFILKNILHWLRSCA